MKYLASLIVLIAVVPAFATPVDIDKRNSSATAVTHTGQATWFDVGVGACGYTNVNTDPIVAISSQIYGTGGNCNQWIKITDTATGHVAYGQVRDECPGCDGAYSLDLSPSLFEQFAALSVGVFDISWNYEPFGFTPPSF